MADITDAQAIAFSNDQIRPLAERVRALKARIDQCATEWFNGVNTVIGSSDEDDLIDGREAEGIDALTAADITNVMTQLLAIQTQLNQSGVAGVIEKPCVRPLDV